MVISKTNYLNYLRHPAWAWLEKHDKSKLPAIDADTQAIFDAGNLFESYAEKIFPDGVTLGFIVNGNFDFMRYQALPNVTRKAIEDKTRVLFQGRFEADELTCIFDALERNEDGTHNLYEIKSTTKAKSEHEHDLAFQTIVLEKAGLKVKNIYIIHVNNEYVRNGEIDHNEITTTVEISSAVRSIIDETAINIKKAKAVIEAAEMPDPSPRHVGLCGYQDWLKVYKNLKPNLDKYSFYNLWWPDPKRIGEFEDEGIVSLKDIADEENLTVKQRDQVQTTKSGKRQINKEEINDFLKAFRFPLYFLDYETFAGVVPLYDGVRPYQQVPFQYSLHILESPEAELKHKQYLHTENSHPVEQLVSQLTKDIGSEGSILVWYQSFEKKCNETMGEFSPKYADLLYSLNDRIIDLMTPFSQGWFVDKDFFGSSSIKMVLPVLAPHLSYSELDISGGTTAQRLWMETIAGGKNGAEKDKIIEDLLKYCHLDTLAMVEIWKVLKGL